MELLIWGNSIRLARFRLAGLSPHLIFTTSYFTKVKSAHDHNNNLILLNRSSWRSSQSRSWLLFPYEAAETVGIAIELPTMTGFSEFALKLVGAGASIIAIAILWNLIRQIFLKNQHEPPVVFHWLPIIGSTVTYGTDPLKFFAQCQAKVRLPVLPRHYSLPLLQNIDQLYSMAISLPSSSSARRRQSTSAQRGITSYSMLSTRMQMQRIFTQFSQPPSSAVTLYMIVRTRSSWNKRRSVTGSYGPT
jgi:hypothetical protein